jgi:hypothetical protein
MRLARLDERDLSTVLDGLSSAARQRVENLLSELTDGPTMQTPLRSAARSDLSPWLQERLKGDASGMTSHALAIFRECAHGDDIITAGVAAQKIKPSLFQNMLNGRSKR